MKKILKATIVMMFAILMFGASVYAKGYVKPSRTSMTIINGSSGTFSVTASNAAGRIDISSSNPSVASVNVANKFLDNSSVTVRVTGKSVGTATIYVKLTDVATYDKEPLSSTYKITVKVEKAKSSNANLKSISVEDYTLEKVSDAQYKLEVDNNISSIVIKAAASDSKAKVSGTGEKNIEVGENILNVVVTAESGAKKTYKIVVTRKDGFYLEDLVLALRNKETIIKLKEDDVIKTEDLNLVRDSGKQIALNYYNDKGTVLYSWKIDGGKLTKYTEISTNVVFDSEYKEQIGERSNYAAGKYIHFKQEGSIVKGTTVKLYVGDIYKDTDILNVYLYNKEKNELTLATDKVSILNGYIEITPKEYGDYFITRSTIKNTKSQSVIVAVGDLGENLKVIAIIEAVVIIALSTTLVFVIKKRK